MESAPPKWRGILSGIVQSGYSIGYLLAAVDPRFVLPTLGWRAMFWSRRRSRRCWRSTFASGYASRKHGKSIARLRWVRLSVPQAVTGRFFLYLVLLMTLMMFLSHGTQDLYPDFLKTARGFDPKIVAYLVIIFNVGAVLGFPSCSDIFPNIWDSS